jgi:phosphate:Na+ symporter
VKNQLRFLFVLALVLFSNSAGVFSFEKLIKVSGDKQIGIKGYPLKGEFVVKVVNSSGMPLGKVPVVFSVIGDDRSVLTTPLVMSDREGISRTGLNLGSTDSDRIFVTANTRGTIGDPVIFEVMPRSRNWLLSLIVGIIGGLGLFLFGMFYMIDALQKVAGKKLRETLISITGSPLRGVFSGFFATLLNQSSSATTVLEVSLVSAGLLTFYQTMAITMGAEIGSTITTQLIAFKLTNYAIFLTGIGFFIFIFSKYKTWKNVGQMIIGFGILFLGIKIIMDMFCPLSDYTPFIELLKHTEKPLYAIGIGLLLTMIFQSSGAMSGIVIALALTGLVSLRQAIFLNLGANIGTCVTAWLGAIGRGREGKRTALWHVLHQTAGVLIVLPFLTAVNYKGDYAWISFVKWFTHTFFRTDDLARQIAMSHTLVPIFNALLFFPLLPVMNKLLCFILPHKEEEKAFGPLYIDKELIGTPSLAFEQARKEIVREGGIVLEMMRESMNIFDSRDLRLIETVSLMDIHVDILRNEIIPFLTQVGQGYLTEEQSKVEIQFLFITADFEAIGDVIDKNILPLARKKLINKLWFSDEGWKDIVDLHSKVMQNLQNAITALRENNSSLPAQIIENKGELNLYETELRRRHIERLHSGLQESLETSSVHLDIIDQLKRINSYIVAICYSLLGRT